MVCGLKLPPAGSRLQTISAHSTARRWLIGGRVQGVGFRPFVCVLAGELGIYGSVRNHGLGVEIIAASDPARAELFLRRLLSEHPPIALPEVISAEPCTPPVEMDFRILPSNIDKSAGGVLLPDQSICAQCLAEMADPGARRHRYPFTTCTQCGPRYTIMQSRPFDRAATSMATFSLCAACTVEYERPADRRFHAQTIGCTQCGPRLTWHSGARRVSGNEAALDRAIDALRHGAIVAVKGIGGYHLLCDARNDAVVRELRARKRRPAKPLAVLFPRAGADELSRLRLHCAPDVVEACSLRSPERPIVLVRRLAASDLSAAIAPGLREIGALLPYSPLHELITGRFDGPLVATSGNIGGDPVLTDPPDAERRLAEIADAFLHHDRPILQPADDGVVRVVVGVARKLRLGRGSSPVEHLLPCKLAAPILALGGQMKATLALGFGARVVVSPHIGDLTTPRGLDLLAATAATLQRLYGVAARTLVCDAHSGYASTRWAGSQGLPVLRVAHHHAHAAAVAGEFPQEPRWLCFTWDGVGLGNDGTLWGGEALLGGPGAWTRAATFRPFAPPGAELAAREPWRSAAALCWELARDWAPVGIDTSLARHAWDRRLNCPPTSSVGRLFDAAAALLGVVHHASHEGEAPMALEALASAEPFGGEPASLPLQRRPDGVWQADWAPLVPMLLDRSRSPGQRAATFHLSLARAAVAQASAVRATCGDFAVGLAGGVFQNRRLSEDVLDALAQAGFRAHLPVKFPCNDAGLSFGQIIEAAAR
jgi:hydrogenase maturation protein HypF